MGVSINNISVNPQNITPPNAPFTLTYNGFVDSPADNPVSITVTLEDGTPVYIGLTAADRLKTLTFTDNLPIGAAADRSKGLFVGIDPPAAGGNCGVAVHFVPANNSNFDDELTHFNY